MAVLPGVLGCRTLRRTVQVRLGPIPRYRGTVARWHAHLRGLATAIHKISGLEANYTYHQSTPLTCQPGIIIHFAFYLSQRAQRKL